MDRAEISEERQRKIEFLIQRELGIPGRAYFETQTNDEFQADDIDDFADERNARWDELSKLPDLELTSVYEQSRAQLEADWATISKPISSREAAYWMDADAWSVAEGVSLSFGTAPRPNDSLSDWAYRNWRIHTGAQQVAARFWYIYRAIQIGSLDEVLVPGKFLEWLALKSFGLPDVFKIYYAPREGIKDETSETLRQAQNEIVVLRSQIDFLMKEVEAKPYISEHSLYGIIAVMAAGKYRSEISGRRKKLPAKISADLALNGIKLNPKQVRTHIQRAIGILPKHNRIDFAPDDEPDEA